MRPRHVEPIAGPLQAHISATPSKSMTHRALVAAALADGPSRIHRPLVADDTKITLQGIQALGIPTRVTPDYWEIQGQAGKIAGGQEAGLGESGTSFRFLLALASLGAQPTRFDGAPRLRERPIRDLSRALCQLGGDVEFETDNPGLPLRVGGRLPQGGSVSVSGRLSSQFVSAMLLIGSALPQGLQLILEPPAVSYPYIELTLEVLETFGVPVDRPGPYEFRIGPGRYSGTTYTVPGDHSSASYFLAAPAVVGGRVRVDDLRPDSLQPDARLGPLLEQLGCRVRRGEDWIEVEGDGTLQPFDVDLGEAPDLAPTVAVLGLFAEGPSVIRGVAHLRLKETDRLACLADNLNALGRSARAGEDTLEIGPRQEAMSGRTAEYPVGIRTDSDHRMAMAFALVGLTREVVLDDADCVAKSNPAFWDQLGQLRPGSG